jgi:hypothetical protein
MILAILALLAAMWGGLLRLGWGWPPLQPVLPLAHGPLMVSGFLGTVVGLERAVALNQRWAFLSPLFTGLGALAVIAGLPVAAGAALMTLGGLGLVAVFGHIIRRQPALFTGTMGLGALAWLVGNALWLVGRPIYQVVLWWAAFLLLTIAGERLELARVLRPSPASRAAFLLTTGVFMAGTVVASFVFGPGVRIAGLGMLGMAAWLLRYDIARRTVRKPGLTRFIAVCLLAGYVWLAAGGLMGLIYGGVPAGPRYDALLHALFLGFVFSMIFGHAPIILPAVLGVRMVFDRTLYILLLLLHLSLLLRVIGDLSGWGAGRQGGGLLNAIVLLLFLANTARVIRKGRVGRIANPPHAEG